jgi:hypothetical protein
MSAEQRFKGSLLVMTHELKQQFGIARGVHAPGRQSTDVVEDRVPLSLCHAWTPGKRFSFIVLGEGRNYAVFFRNEPEALAMVQIPSLTLPARTMPAH